MDPRFSLASPDAASAALPVATSGGAGL